MAQLNGRLNRDVTSANYGGVDTSSVKMHVDNNKMTISADVIWSDILGQTADKAYPGNLGSLNSSKIRQLASDLIAEIERSKKAERDLQTYIDSIDVVDPSIERAVEDLKQSVYTLSNSYDSLLSRISIEITRAIESEDRLSDEIRTESEARISADNDLSRNIDAVQSSLTLRLSSAESDLNAEKIRAEAAEQLLHNDIDSLKQTTEDQIESINSEIVRVKESTSYNSEGIDTNRLAITDLDGKLKRAEESIDDNTSVITDTVRRLNNVESSLEEISRTITDVSDTIDQSVADLSGKIDTTDQKVMNNQQQIADVRLSLDRLQTSVADQFEESKNSISETKDEISNDISTLESTVQSNIAALQLLIDQLLENSASKDQLTSLSDTVNQYKETTDDSISDLNQSLAEQGSALSRLGSTVSIINDSVNSLSSDTESLLNKSNDAQEKIEELEAQLQILSTLPSELSDFQEETKLKFEETDFQISSIKSLIANNESSFNAKLDIQSQAHSEDINNLRTFVETEDSRLDDSINALTDTVDKHVKASASEFSNIEFAIYEHEEDLDILRNDLTNAQQSFIARQQILEANMTQKDTELSENISALDEDMKLVTESIKSTIDSVSELSDKQIEDVTRLTNSIVDMSSKCEDCMSELLEGHNAQQELLDSASSAIVDLQDADEELSKRIDRKHSEAISYTDSKLSDIDTLIDETFDEHFKIRIIDGGNAPI